MTESSREFLVGCYIFSLDRIPRYVEELTAEWAYHLQNLIPISRGLAQRIDGWGIPFPSIIPQPYTTTLRPPTERGCYIP